MRLPILTSQKLFKTDGDIPIPVFIVALENIGHSLQTDTRLHKEVEAHARIRPGTSATPALALEGTVEHPDKGATESISKCDQRFLKLIQTDATAPIFVETFK